MGAKLKPEDKKVIEQVELLADATTETARRFVARVKERKGPLRTEGGRAITVREIADNLVTRVGLEHAIVEKERPKEVICETCPAPIRVPKKGGNSDQVLLV